MSELILLMSEALSGPWEWGLASTGEHGIAITGEEKTALSGLNYAQLIAVIPGAHVVTKLHTLESLSDKQMRQAAGFSVEDELAAPLGDTHLAFDTNSARLAIVSAKTMDELIENLEEAGLSPDVICADYDSFDGSSFSYKDRVVQMLGSGLGYSIEADTAAHVLGTEQNLPRAIDREQFLENIAGGIKAGHKPINLRQGQYTKRAEFGAGRIKRIGAMAAALLAAFAALNIGQGIAYKNKANTAQDKINEIYAQAFPDTAIPSNPVLPMLRAQADRKANKGDEFIHLSTVLAASVKQVAGVEISSLRYDKGKAQLSLSVLYDSFDDVESLKQAVRKNGGSFSESGTRQNGDGLSGDAVLRVGS